MKEDGCRDTANENKIVGVVWNDTDLEVGVCRSLGGRLFACKRGSEEER